MNNLDEVVKLQRKVESLKAAAERARGAAESLRKTLRADWDCETLGEARKLLEKKEAEVELLASDFAGKLSSFKEEWGDELGAVG